ncbi:general transcription factor IIE subunit 1-like isoform X2 [Babylonia areolata]|uniref:general transcription factor IIE subunit 1-like isoform X2 n=1 Tax=Babylonia areolata TaxID=304850 RepID=UPI003FD324B4
MDADVQTEVPLVLKKLVRLITRGFFTMEHAIIVDMLVRHPCIKEDDLAELLRYEKRHLRALLNTLKNEKFLKSRMRVETDADGRSTRHSYYFISYNVFVNVVKYKLDHIRKKIEQEERNSSSRASFKCPDCSKTFTDFEVGQLLDFATQRLLCTFCQAEVAEDESSLPAKDARTSLARFNEQIQPIYDLLQECEEIKLAANLLEPEPTDIRKLTRSQGANQQNKARPDADNMVWSGSSSRNLGFGYSESSVTITVGEDGGAASPEKKEVPIWMQKSTVDGVPMLDGGDTLSGAASEASTSRAPSSAVHNEDIMQTLLVHEPKAGSSRLPDQESSDDSDREAESFPIAAAGGDVEEMESEEEDDLGPMITIGDKRLSYHEVTDEMVASMTPAEKEEYIRIGQEMYENYYE